MPFYDLRCGRCKHDFRTMASMSDRAEQRTLCPECGSNELEAVFKSAPAYIMKSDTPACPNSHVCGSGCCHSRGN